LSTLTRPSLVGMVAKEESKSLAHSVSLLSFGALIHIISGGHGSHGGDGGRGGVVEIRVSEYNMHLAYATNWDVSGGTGGRAGNHDSGGPGGRGGRGGSGYSWYASTNSLGILPWLIFAGRNKPEPGSNALLVAQQVQEAALQ
jgi:hypothetical protein